MGYEKALFASSDSSGCSFEGRDRSPSWETVSSMGPGLATVELFINETELAAWSPEPIDGSGTVPGLAWESTCISSDTWIERERWFPEGSPNAFEGAWDLASRSPAPTTAPNASRATCGPPLCWSSESFSGSATLSATAVLAMPEVGLEASKPGEGEVRRPALAIELRCESGLAEDGLSREI
jgi:hypothetical protein